MMIGGDKYSDRFGSALAGRYWRNAPKRNFGGDLDE